MTASYTVYSIYMISKTWLALGGVLIVALAVGGILFFSHSSSKQPSPQDPNALPKNVTLSGTFECLSHVDSTGPQTEECAFGFKTDDGVHYALNFGESAHAMAQFQSGEHVTADGFVVNKIVLNTNQWDKYVMEGIFTITKITSPVPPQAQAKINIDAVCKGALAYMSFPDGASSDAFVKDCVDGKHPEVIERYKASLNLGDGAAI